MPQFLALGDFIRPPFSPTSFWEGQGRSHLTLENIAGRKARMNCESTKGIRNGADQLVSLQQPCNPSHAPSVSLGEETMANQKLLSVVRRM